MGLPVRTGGGIYHDFPTPKEMKEYQALIPEHNRAVDKYNTALADYQAARTVYLSSDIYSRQALGAELNVKERLLMERESDLKEIKAQLLALLSKG